MNNRIFRFLDRVNTAVSIDYSRIIKSEQTRLWTNYLALNEQSYGCNSELRDPSKQVIVSLTTYGERIYTVHLVIQSLFMQTYKADKVVLWLAEDECSNIPIVLENMTKRGLEIRRCPNYRSYKKLVPMLSKEPNSVIVTVDDDIIYPENLIENLMRTHWDNPDCIVFTNGKHMCLNASGMPVLYDSWSDNKGVDEPSILNFAVGVGGVLYPPGSLHEDVVNSETFMVEAPDVDDIWFWMMANRLKTKYVQATKGIKITSQDIFLKHFITTEDTQSERLGRKNVLDGKNNFYLQKLIEKFGLNKE